MNSRLTAGHSADFVAAWRSVHCDIYRWQRQDLFAVVPSLFGAPTFAYLPGLNYADLNVAQARGLAGEMAGRSFNIRTLTEPQGEPPPDTPAVLRVDLAAFGNDRDAIWKQALRRAKRKAVRRARKAGLTCAEETGPAALRAFRGLLSATLVRHGAPLMPAALFDALIGEMGARILVVRDTKGEARASLLWLRDGPLAWVPWSGSLWSSDCPRRPALLAPARTSPKRGRRTSSTSGAPPSAAAPAGSNRDSAPFPSPCCGSPTSRAISTAATRWHRSCGARSHRW